MLTKNCAHVFLQGNQVREVLDKEEAKLDHRTEELLQKGASSQTD